MQREGHSIWKPRQDDVPIGALEVADDHQASLGGVGVGLQPLRGGAQGVGRIPLLVSGSPFLERCRIEAKDTPVKGKQGAFPALGGLNGLGGYLPGGLGKGEHAGGGVQKNGYGRRLRLRFVVGMASGCPARTGEGEAEHRDQCHAHHHQKPVLPSSSALVREGGTQKKPHERELQARRQLTAEQMQQQRQCRQRQ